MFGQNWTTTPASGQAINLAANPAGVSSITINVKGATANRDAKGYVTLRKNGVVLKQIPASNERMFYFTESAGSFDKLPSGCPNFVFFMEQSSTPANKPGDYEVTVPAGFFTVAGEKNPELRYIYRINGSAQLEGDVNPAKGSAVSELSTVTFTFPGATKVTYTDNSTPIVWGKDEDGNPKIISGEYAVYMETLGGIMDLSKNVTTEGNTATISITEKLAPSTVRLWLKAGCFKDESGVANPAASYNFVITEASTGNWSITPAPGAYTEFPAVDYSAETGMANLKGYFVVKTPEDLKYTMVMSGKAIFTNENGTTVTFALQKLSDNSGWVIVTPVSYQGANKVYSEAPLALESGKWNITFTGKLYSGGMIDIPAEAAFGPYTITAGENAIKYTVTPADGDVIEEISNVVITFEEGAEVKWDATQWATLTSETVQYDVRGTADGNKVVLALPTTLSLPGEFTVIVPSNAIKVNGASFPGFKAVYNIDLPYVKELEVVAGNGGKISECFFTAEGEDYNNYWTVVASFAAGEPLKLTYKIPSGYDSFAYMNQSLGIGGEPLRPSRIPASDIEAGGFTINNTGEVTDLIQGVNLIAIALGANGHYTTPCLAITTIDFESGVAEITVADNVEFYTLQGVKVANPEKGIYIMVTNGKAQKVVL